MSDTQHVDMTLQREAEDDCGYHPANSVVDDGGGEDDLTDPAAQEVHLPDYGSHDFNGGNR